MIRPRRSTRRQSPKKQAPTKQPPKKRRLAIDRLESRLMLSAEIRGFAWDDTNGDGEYDFFNENEIEGVTVYLDENRNNRFDDDEPSQITDALGNYVFTGLAAGTYIVAQVPPDNYAATFPKIISSGWNTEAIGSNFGGTLRVAVPAEGGYPAIVGRSALWIQTASGWSRHSLALQGQRATYGLAYEPVTQHPYVADTLGDQIFLKHFDGVRWHSEIVFTGAGITGVSLAFNPDTGLPEMAVTEGGFEGDVHHIWRGPTEWQATDVFLDGFALDSPSLAFDPNTGNAAVSFGEFGAGGRTLLSLQGDAGWQPPIVIAAMDPDRTEVRFLPLTGEPVVAYARGAGLNTLNIAFRQDDGSWQSRQVDASANRSFAMEVTPANEIFLSWARTSSSTILHLARWQGNDPDSQTNIDVDLHTTVTSPQIVYNGGALNVVVAGDFLASTLPAHTVQLDEDDIKVNLNFGVQSPPPVLPQAPADPPERPDPVGEIRGRKWHDLNGNGLRDAGEPQLAGWTIYADENGNGALDEDEPSTVTDVNGNYALTGLAKGTYSVQEVQQNGWVQTSPRAFVPNPDWLFEEIGPRAGGGGDRLVMAHPVGGGQPGIVNRDRAVTPDQSNPLVWWSKTRGGWERRTVVDRTDTLLGVAASYDFAYEPDTGYPHVAYIQGGQVHLTHFDGTRWHTESVLTGEVAGGLSLEFNPLTGLAELAIFTNIPGVNVQLLHVFQGPSAWQSTQVSTAFAGRSPQLAINPLTGHAAISYVTFSTTNFAWFDGVNWFSEDVSTDKATQTALEFTSQSGIPAMAYHLNGSLQLGFRENGTWQFHEVETTALRGDFGLTAAPQDEIYISWTRGTGSRALRAAMWNGQLTTWTVGIDGNTGSAMIALNNDAIQIAYRSDSSGGYRFATTKPAHTVEVDLKLDGSEEVLCCFDFGNLRTAGPSADLTGNGFVDFQDLTILLANWNRSVTAGEGNLVEPLGTPVNFQDLTVLLAAWTGPGPAGAPEAPAAIAGTYSFVTPQEKAVAGSRRAVMSAHFDEIGRQDRLTSRRAIRRRESGLSGVSSYHRLQAVAVDRVMIERLMPEEAETYSRRSRGHGRRR
jgi:hypothetical protein